MRECFEQIKVRLRDDVAHRYLVIYSRYTVRAWLFSFQTRVVLYIVLAHHNAMSWVNDGLNTFNCCMYDHGQTNIRLLEHTLISNFDSTIFGHDYQ